MGNQPVKVFTAGSMAEGAIIWLFSYYLKKKKGGFPAQVRAPKVRIPVGGFGVAIPPKNHVQLKNHITIQKQHQWVIKLKNKHSRREC